MRDLVTTKGEATVEITLSATDLHGFVRDQWVVRMADQIVNHSISLEGDWRMGSWHETAPTITRPERQYLA